MPHDGVLSHSVLEALDRPADALREMRRILRPGGVIGVASVDYGGLIIAGGEVEELEKFYRVREELWLRSNIGKPRLGRHLGALLEAAGFSPVRSSARYISYGTRDSIFRFASERAQECQDPVLAESLESLGLVDAAALAGMRKAWQQWADDADAFLAFAWCNAIGWK